MSRGSHVAGVNAALTWFLALGTFVFVGAGVAGVGAVPAVDPLWGGLAVLVAVVAVLPAVRTLRPAHVGLWPLTLLATGAPLVRAVGTATVLGALRAAGAAAGVAVELDAAGAVAFVATFADAVALAALALLAVAQVQTFSRLQLTVDFAAVVVAATTVGLTGLWAVVRWTGAQYLGTPFPPTNVALMWEFAAAAAAAVVAAGALTPYFGHPDRCVHPDAGTPRTVPPPSVEGGLAVRLTQLLLVVVLALGLRRRDVAIVANAVGALMVTASPALVRRRLRVTLDPRLTALVGAAVLVHAVGTLGPYATVGWWDEAAHALSAGVVAAAGYSLARALDVRQECLSLPPAFLFAYVLLFVAATGVVWELFEFAVGAVSTAAGLAPLLAQPSLGDTVSDLAFDALGAVVVALLGTARLALGRGTDLPGEGQPSD